MGIRVVLAELSRMRQPLAPTRDYTMPRVPRFERRHSPNRQKRASRFAQPPAVYVGRMGAVNFLPISYQIQTWFTKGYCILIVGRFQCQRYSRVLIRRNRGVVLGPVHRGETSVK